MSGAKAIVPCWNRCVDTMSGANRIGSAPADGGFCPRKPPGLRKKHRHFVSLHPHGCVEGRLAAKAAGVDIRPLLEEEAGHALATEFSSVVKRSPSVAVDLVGIEALVQETRDDR